MYKTTIEITGAKDSVPEGEYEVIFDNESESRHFMDTIAKALKKSWRLVELPEV